MTDLLERSERVCVFAHYDPNGRVADHVVHYLNAVVQAGFAVIFVTTADLEGEARSRLGMCADVIQRPNSGYDFGSWREGMCKHKHCRPSLLLLCNDSVYGPSRDLAAFIEQMLDVDADFYSPVCSIERGLHGQSWFMLFRPRAYLHDVFAKFFFEVAAGDWEKLRIVDTFEIGLTRTLLSAGLRLSCIYDARRDGMISAREPINPMHFLWDQLLAVIPFVKVDLLRTNPGGVPRLAEWPRVVDERAPGLRPMIERDLDRSGGDGRHQEKWRSWTWRARLSRSPVNWSFAQRFLRTDFALVRDGRLKEARANLALYLRWSKWLARLARFISIR